MRKSHSKETRLPDARADQYSLAAIMFEMLTGKTPNLETGRSPRKHRPRTPVPLDVAIYCALSNDVELRYSDFSRFKKVMLTSDRVSDGPRLTRVVHQDLLSFGFRHMNMKQVHGSQFIE